MWRLAILVQVQALVSFCAGILGGIAGPGGMLAIVPATWVCVVCAQLVPECFYCRYYDTAAEAFAYIGTFFIASTLMMGIVAAIYGEGEMPDWPAVELIVLFSATYRVASRSIGGGGSLRVVKIV